MNKKLSSGLALILPNKKTNLFVIFIIILGIISGSLFMVILGENDRSAVINQISTFFNNINSNNINNFVAFKNALITNFIYSFLIWILGMSIIGIIFNIFFIYLKGFTIGFSLSAFFILYKYKGILAGFIYVFPSVIINVIVTLIISVYAILFTIYLWKLIFLKEKEYNMGKFLKKYVLVLIISLFLSLISSLTEGYLLPSMMKLVVKMFV